MKTITEIHRENLRLLVDEMGGVTAVADKLGATVSQFSQWLNGSRNSGTGKPRGISTATARRIEQACGKPAGWMDKEHAGAALYEPSSGPKLTLATQQEIDLLDQFRRCTEDGVTFVLDAVRMAEKKPLASIRTHNGE